MFLEEVLCAKLQGQGEVEEREGKEQEGGKQSKERDGARVEGPNVA